MIHILAKHCPIEGVPENGMVRIETTDTGQKLWVSKDEIIEVPDSTPLHYGDTTEYRFKREEPK